MKKFKILIFIVLLITILLGLTSYRKKSSINTIKIGVLNTPNDVAIARNAKLFQKNIPNYKFKFIIFDSGVDANKALMTNSIDLATMGDTNAIVALTNDIPAKLLFINEICQNNEELVTRNESHISNIKDLKGKKIATPFASTSHLSLLYLLNKYDIENKVQLFDMDTQNIVASWQRKQIDAAYTWEPTLSQLKKNGKIICSSKQIAEDNMITGNVTLVSNKFAYEHSNLCLKIKQILLNVHKMRKKHPQKAIQLAANQLGISYSTAKLQINGTKWLNKTEEDSYLQQNGKFIKAMNFAGQYMYKNQSINFAPSNKKIYKFVWNDKND